MPGLDRLQAALPKVVISSALLFLMHVGTSWGNGLDTALALKAAASFVLVQFAVKCLSLLEGRRS